jgi:CheY-like chemotaxis protein
MQIGVETSRAVDNKRIFVVDDDEIARAALQFMLHDENETHELADVDAALSKNTLGAPDVILLSTNLLRVHGVSVLDTFKARFTGVKLLLVAQSRNDPAAAEGLQHGADAVLTKPLTVEATRKSVDRLLGRSTRTVIPIHAA